MNADIAFQDAANKAAALAASPPAYVSYISRTHIAIPSLHRERDVNCSEITRTSDGVTSVTDLPRGRERLETSAFPLAPTFNAVSAFDLQYGMTLRGTAWFHLSNVRSMTYRKVDLSDADVVVVSTRGYRVRFAPDSSDTPAGTTHILLTPSRDAMKTAPRNSYFFSEMLIDNASGLPTRIAYVGENDFHMYFTYAVSGGRWSIQSAHLESTLHAPLNFGRVHFLADTMFADTQYGANAPISALVPANPINQATSVPAPPS